MTTWTKELARIPLHDSIVQILLLLLLHGGLKQATDVSLCRNGLERCCRSGSNVTGAPLARPANLRPKSRNPLFFHQLLRSASFSLSLPFCALWRSSRSQFISHSLQPIMFRPAVRALARAPIAAPCGPASRRLISTGPSKSRSWKNTVLRLGLAGGAIYYYNTSSAFAKEPECMSSATGPSSPAPGMRTQTKPG